MSNQNSGSHHPPMCPQCGQNVLPDDQFCFHCGANLAPQPRVGPSPRLRKKRPWWLYGLAGLVVVGLGSLIFRGHTSQKSAATPPKNLSAASSRHHHSHQHPSTAPSTSTPASVSPGPTPSSTSSNNPGSGWITQTVPYNGGTVSLQLPSALSHVESQGGGQWVYGPSSGTSGTAGSVTLEIVGQKSSSATQSLGPGTYGTAITNQGSLVSQTLYVQWPQHGWVRVAMSVPGSQESWIRTIAQSVQIT